MSSHLDYLTEAKVHCREKIFSTVKFLYYYKMNKKTEFTE